MFDPQDRNQFLNFAGVFEGGLALLALGLGWLVSINPVEHLFWDWRALVWGVLGAGPLFALFVAVYLWPIGPFRTIRGFLSRELAPSLANLTWYDLILMALLAGVAEELLFRGLLEPWIGRPWSNVLFGLAHIVTPTYGLLTFLVGLYLSWLMTMGDLSWLIVVPDAPSPNLLAPIVTHAVHDYLAFLMIVWLHGREHPQPEIAE